MTLYLNKSGHRWINITNGKKEKINVYFPESKRVKSYTVFYWEALGNFAAPYVRIKGKVEQLTEGLSEKEFIINNEKNTDWKRLNRLNGIL